MKQRMKKIFGIDLGTTYSSIAYIDENGQPVIVPNSDNNPVTPSVVFFDRKEVVVGEVANESGKIHPERVVTLIKRSMGDPNFRFKHGEKVYRAEEISSYIIRKVVQDAEQQLNEKISEVVITCPAYFGVSEREATQRAGELAGLNVRQIINEPTAAAITYASMTNAENRTVLVYDLGGGTFDITLIDIQADSIEVVCTGGDQSLGGKDWDDCLMNSLAKAFHYKTGLRIDRQKDPDLFHELELAVEKTKRVLGQRKKAPVVVTHAGRKVKIELERNKFEHISNTLLSKTVAFTYEMLDEAKKKGYKDFDEVILVGGATRMPQVAYRIEQEFSKKPRIFDPDGAVAKGAAIFGWKLALNDMLMKRITAKTGKILKTHQDEKPNLNDVIDTVPEAFVDNATKEMSEETGFTLPAVKRSMIEIKNVTSKSFGIVVNNEKQDEVIFNLILKNTQVPVDVTRSFPTGVDNQDTVLIRIMENAVSERNVLIEDGNEIGTAVLKLPSGLKIHSPVDINFKLTDEGRLLITAKEATESRQVDVTIETSNVIHGEEFKKAKERSAKIVIQ